MKLNFPIASMSKKLSPDNAAPAAPATQPAPAQPQPKAKQPAAATPNFSDQFSRGITSVPDIIAPSAIEVDFSFQKIGNSYFRTLFVSGYPRFVNANWLSPLINFDHPLTTAMYIYPVEGKDIMDDLRRKVGEMEAEIQSDTERGRIADPTTKVRLEDAKKLQEQLAKGAEHFFQFGLYITVTAKTLDELNKISQQVQSTLGSLMIIAKTASLQIEQAFKTTLPTAHDRLMITRNMDTTSLATTFPFTSSELTQNQGILYGMNEHNGSLIILDRFSMENANSVIFAKSGAGKSIAYHEPVLYDDGSGPKLGKIGPLIEKLIRQKGAQPIDDELEGVIDPGIKVYTFDQNLKVKWAKVTVAARKKSPRTLYRFTTASGRQITTTADHNLITIKDGRLEAIKGNQVNTGDFIPLARKIDANKIGDKQLNLLSLLKNSDHVYVAGFSQIIKVNRQKLKIAQLNPGYDRYLYLYAKNRPLPLGYFYQIIDFLGIKPTDAIMDKLHLGCREFDPKTTFRTKVRLSSALFKIIGFYLAEGSSSPTAVHLSQIDNAAKNEVKFNLKKLKLNFFTTKKDLVVPSRVFAEIIKALNLGSDAARKKMPSFIFSQPKNKIAQLLQFYFEGDGTVDNHEVTVVSKSKRLISEISYLLTYFGIVARIKPVFKRARNSTHLGGFYYQLKISGAANLTRFKQSIGFVSDYKKQKLAQIISAHSNTNVDVIPSLEPSFKELYELLYSSSEIASPTNLSPLKRGVFRPSPTALKRIIKEIEKRINQLETYPRHGFKQLDLINSNNVPLFMIKEEIYQGFAVLGASLQNFDKSLWVAITQRPLGGTGYEKLLKAKQFLKREFNDLQPKLFRAKELLKNLKLLASSELFWDPVVNIKKMPSTHPYVYDLTVDNEVFLAGYAGMFVHNSYLVKLEALRSLMFDTEVIIIDPENEYQTLCTAVGGQYINFSFSASAKINPFDLSQVYEEGQNELGQKVLSLHSLFKIIMGQITPQEEALLDRAIIMTYKQKGITPDPGTQKKEPPLLEDLYKVLVGMEEAAAEALAARLEKYVKGSSRGVFDQQTNIDIKSTFTVFSIRELEDALRPVAMFMILDFIWTKIKRDLKKRLLIIDEAWWLMKYPDSASFVYSMAKRARKYYLGLSTITQDVEDFLGSDYGKAIVTNSSIQILMKQSTAAIDNLAKVFYLSEGEKHLLLSAGVGHGIIFAGANHVALNVVASPEEHALITSNPEEILKRQAAATAAAQSVPPSTVATPPAPQPTPTPTKPATPPTPTAASPQTTVVKQATSTTPALPATPKPTA